MLWLNYAQVQVLIVIFIIHLDNSLSQVNNQVPEKQWWFSKHDRLNCWEKDEQLAP